VDSSAIGCSRIAHRAARTCAAWFGEHSEEFYHAERIASNFPKDDQCRCVAWLHDLIENKPLSLNDIERSFGPDIRRDVDALTRRDGEVYADYIARVCASGDVPRRVKIEDVLDNLTRPGCEARPQSERLRWARALVKLLEAAPHDPSA